MITKESIQGGYPIKGLGEVVEFLDNLRSPITKSDRTAGPYPYYGANGQQDSVADYIFDEPLVLIAEDGGLFDQPDRGIAYAIEGKTWVNNHAHVLRPLDSIDLRYLVRVLENYDVNPWITGSTRAKLTKAGASKIQIPLPPLAEQKRIAGILDAADALRAKRRESIDQLDRLIQATFLEKFGDPDHWEKKSVRSLSLDESGAFSNGPFGSNLLTSELTDSGVPVIYIRDIRDSEYKRVSKVFVTDKKAEELSTCQTFPGDLLIAKVGDPPGVSAVYPVGEPVGIITQDVIRLRADTRVADSSYLSAYFNSKYGQRLIQSITVEATRARFGLGDFKKQEIPLPPLGDQKNISTILDSIESQRAFQRDHLSVLDTLFASIQSQAFSGAL